MPERSVVLVPRLLARHRLKMLVPVQKQKAEREPGGEAAVVPERGPILARALELAREPESEQDLIRVPKQGFGQRSDKMPEEKLDACGFLERLQPLKRVSVTVPARPLLAKW